MPAFLPGGRGATIFFFFSLKLTGCLFLIFVTTGLKTVSNPCKVIPNSCSLHIELDCLFGKKTKTNKKQTTGWPPIWQIRAFIRAKETHIISQFQSVVHIQASNVPTDEGPSAFTPETDEDYRCSPVDCAMIVEDSQSPESSGSSDLDEATFNSSEEITKTQKLQHWASVFSVPLVPVTALLAILIMYHPDLPKDARRSLKTT